MVPSGSGGRASAPADNSDRVRSVLGLDRLASEMRERKGGEAARGQPVRGSMSFDFETDEASVVKSMVPPPMPSRASDGTKDVDTSTGAGSAAASESKKRQRSFRVVAPEDSGKNDRWDGSSFGQHSTSTFNMSKVAKTDSGARPRWGGSTTSGGTSTTYGSALTSSSTPLTAPGTLGWTGAGGESAAGSVAPGPRGYDDDENFDRDYYQMEVCGLRTCSHVCV